MPTKDQLEMILALALIGAEELKKRHGFVLPEVAEAQAAALAAFQDFINPEKLI